MKSYRGKNLKPVSWHASCARGTRLAKMKSYRGKNLKPASWSKSCASWAGLAQMKSYRGKNFKSSELTGVVCIKCGISSGQNLTAVRFSNLEADLNRVPQEMDYSSDDNLTAVRFSNNTTYVSGSMTVFQCEWSMTEWAGTKCNAFIYFKSSLCVVCLYLRVSLSISEEML